MRKFSITIIESLEKTIDINAVDWQNAINEVKYLYSIGDIVLYPEECDIEVKYEVLEKDIL